MFYLCKTNKKSSQARSYFQECIPSFSVLDPCRSPGKKQLHSCEKICRKCAALTLLLPCEDEKIIFVLLCLAQTAALERRQPCYCWIYSASTNIMLAELINAADSSNYCTINELILHICSHGYMILCLGKELVCQVCGLACMRAKRSTCCWVQIRHMTWRRTVKVIKSPLRWNEKGGKQHVYIHGFP